MPLFGLFTTLLLFPNGESCCCNGSKVSPSQTLVGPPARPCLGMPHQRAEALFHLSSLPTPHPGAVTPPLPGQFHRALERSRFNEFCGPSAMVLETERLLCHQASEDAMWGNPRAMVTQPCKWAVGSGGYRRGMARRFAAHASPSASKYVRTSVLRTRDPELRFEKRLEPLG